MSVYDAWQIKRGDRMPSYSAALTVDEAPVGLTGWTVRFVMRRVEDVDLDPATAGVYAVTGPAVVVNAAAGLVRYDWQAGDTDTAGVYKVEWECTETASGRKRTLPTAGYEYIEVVADLDW